MSQGRGGRRHREEARAAAAEGACGLEAVAGGTRGRGQAVSGERLGRSARWRAAQQRVRGGERKEGRGGKEKEKEKWKKKKIGKGKQEKKQARAIGIRGSRCDSVGHAQCRVRVRTRPHEKGRGRESDVRNGERDSGKGLGF